jgi:hypothetical protein
MTYKPAALLARAGEFQCLMMLALVLRAGIPASDLPTFIVLCFAGLAGVLHQVANNCAERKEP